MYCIIIFHIFYDENILINSFKLKKERINTNLINRQTKTNEKLFQNVIDNNNKKKKTLEKQKEKRLSSNFQSILFRLKSLVYCTLYFK